MHNLLVVINTCSNYFKYSKNSLIEQINNSKLPNVIIVSGQEEKEETCLIDGVKVIKVKYTGLHHTGAIYVVENYKKLSDYKYFMFLPDTIKIGEKFTENINKYYDLYLKNTNLQIFGFINPSVRPSMDMGIFNIQHILRISKYFNHIKTYDLSRENLVRLKYILINDENTIFGQPLSKKGTRYLTPIHKKDKLFLYNNKKCLVEKINHNIREVYFPALDLYKFQRNFKGSNVKLILEYNVN